VDCEPREAVLIGDDIVGDVQGAQRVGVRGILVRTGKFRASDLAGEVRPDAVLDSIADFPAWWRSHSGGAEGG
jgi:ribonucleotide monophosphatase NagD (HAD superfamily)